MSVPNAGPEHPDPNDPTAMDAARKGNPALVHRADQPTDDVQAASARASVVTHRFGGVHYRLTRPVAPPAPPDRGGETDPGT